MRSKFTEQTRFTSLKEMLTYQDLERRHIDGFDARNPDNTWRKNMFRKSKEWKSFCNDIIGQRECCERCGSKEQLSVHHLDPEHYTNLDPKLFKLLCGKCHLQIESFCGTEEKRKQCPKKDGEFLTIVPYKETENKVFAKTGKFLKQQWNREYEESLNPGKWLNTKAMSDHKKKEVRDGLQFIKDHPELFGGNESRSKFIAWERG